MAEYGGFRPWGAVLRAGIYPVVTAYATALYKGDPVIRAADGTVALAAAAADCLGAIIGLLDSNKNPINYLPASTTGDGTYAGYALVADHPDQVYIVGEDLDTTPLALIDQGSNINHVTGTGNTATGLSGCLLDSTSKTTTNTLTFHLVRIAPTNGNAIGNTAPGPQWLVIINSHQLGTEMPGI